MRSRFAQMRARWRNLSRTYSEKVETIEELLWNSITWVGFIDIKMRRLTIQFCCRLLKKIKKRSRILSDNWWASANRISRKRGKKLRQIKCKLWSVVFINRPASRYRTIFRWITVKNLNTMTFDENTRGDTPMGLLRGIKHGTESYHVLFRRLCR